ncbi:hypothetical protein N0V90_007420 [Kalmusia sp. IMI 367209]|nr:hypothetical protein N0V90_007420 [Kalmusia sp. IMI 367209]
MKCCGLPPHPDTESDTDDRASDIRPRIHQSGGIHIFTQSILHTLKVSDMIRIVFTIHGLKCGCCESGISRVLDQIPAVESYNVNIILARVELDLNLRKQSVRKVKRKLTAATGYTFTQYFQPDGQVLEVIVDDPAEIYRAGRPYGVDLVEQTVKSVWTPIRIFSGRNSALPPGSRNATPNRKENSEVRVRPDGNTRPKLLQLGHTVRIHYNAKKIGARDVLHYYEHWAEKEIQLAPPAPHPSLAVGTKQMNRACVVFVLAAIFTVPVIVFAWGPVDHGKIVYAHISMAFATIVQAIAAWEFFPSACRSLIYLRTFDMDFLIALSTTVAYIFSVISYVREIQGKPLDAGSFFETSTLLVTLILLGRVVSEFARSRAARSVSFRSLQVEETLLVVPGPSSPSDPQVRSIDARLLQYGDQFKVLPETRIVTDGTVVHGGSEVDESMITGETLPVAKGRTSSVHAGTNNGSGILIVALTTLPHENSVSKIANMVENAELTKPKAQAIADRVTTWFVPAIVLIALSVFCIQLLVGKHHYHYETGQAAINAFTYAIATFVVSCPCAIGLAVPMVVLIASGVAARFGIIFRDPQKLETARNVTDVVFDKTGTLTTGVLTVVNAEFKNGSATEVERMLLGLLVGIKHPVSVAVYEWVGEKGKKADKDILRSEDMISVQSIPGQGIQGHTKQSNHLVRAGSPAWLGIKDVPEDDNTLLCVTVAGIHRATFFLQSCVRETAKATISHLHSRKIRVHMLTGDHDSAAACVAQNLGISPALVRGRLKPEDKKSYIEAQQADGRICMFVGDGTNDAVAIKQAAVGVHLNRGSDVAKSAADIVLMQPRLMDVVILLDISRAAYRRIIMNFAWSFVYNVGAILLASGAVRKWRIEPQYAGLGELISVVPVVCVAFQMKWRGYGKAHRRNERAID